MRPARFETVRRKRIDGSVRKHLLVAFLWKGSGDSRPRRYRESTGLEDTRASRQLWRGKLEEISRELVITNYGVTAPFDPRRWFPHSRTSATLQLGTMTAQTVTPIRVGDFARSYLDRLAGLTNRTREQYHFIFNAHILPSKFAQVQLAGLTHLDIRAFLRELEEKTTSAGKPLQANTINKILARVRTMLNDAFESGAIAGARNPMALVKNLAVSEREIDPFEPAELLRIFAVCEGQQRALYILLALTGLRPAEALALMPEHVNFADGTILVRQQMIEKGEVSPRLKTKSSRRNVKMFEPVKIALYDVLALNRLRSRFLFCGPMGRPMLERSVGDHPWRRAIARAGVDYHVLYNLRHTYTTLMIRAGKPLQWIAHQLGHVGVKKIDEVYGRWTRTPEEEALDLDAFFLQIMRLPKTALALQRLPNLSQTVDDTIAPASKSVVFSRDFGDEYAPAGNRTRIPVCRQAESLKVNTGRTKQTIETADIWLRCVQFRPGLRRVLVKFSPSAIRDRTDSRFRSDPSGQE
jgi:integrase